MGVVVVIAGVIAVVIAIFTSNSTVVLPAGIPATAVFGVTVLSGLIALLIVIVFVALDLDLVFVLVLIALLIVIVVLVEPIAYFVRFVFVDCLTPVRVLSWLRTLTHSLTAGPIHTPADALLYRTSGLPPVAPAASPPHQQTYPAPLTNSRPAHHYPRCRCS